jgi:hypothetical protein
VTFFQKETFLYEMTVYQIRFGRGQEAYETLAGYLSMRPYSENARLHGLAAMIAGSLWHHDRRAAQVKGINKIKLKFDHVE